MLPFLDLGGIQGVKRCNLTVRTFEIPSANCETIILITFTNVHSLPASLFDENTPICIFDTNLATNLDANFAWTPPLASQSRDDEILAGRIHDFAELEQVDKGIVSVAFEDDVQQVGSVSEDGVSWDIQSLLTLCKSCLIVVVLGVAMGQNSTPPIF
jgi:hypothetical protein